ncbi:2-oxoacid:acceptor oxidoreductase family protein [bacterium]|nr:2-oxoacid:acceptor oxidoreductase family protein [bacterium]
MNAIRQLCLADAGESTILQGNIAFAIGCVRAGIHSVDGYPGTPSTEVIDKGLSAVPDLINASWSVNEAVAAGVGHGHSLAGRDCVVTMKIPGMFQAGDVITSASQFTLPRGALIYYVASDFTPSSTQHVIDPRYTLRSCFIPVFEPRNHQEMHEAASIAVKVARKFNTSMVILASGNLCHSEGLISLMNKESRDPVEVMDFRPYNCLPSIARPNYNLIHSERMPGLRKMVEDSPLNKWIKGAGKTGIITYGINTLFVEEYRALFNPEVDILSLGFTHPLPMNRIAPFCSSINGDVYIIEDGYRFLQEACLQAGLKIKGKAEDSSTTEWSPASIASFLGNEVVAAEPDTQPLNRPPLICAGCPYTLFAEAAKRLKKRKKLEVIFGDIGCNSLLYFLNAMDTGVAMGASESKRIGYVSSKPESASRCISVIGDSTECHSGMDATRNAIYNNSPGVKVVLDNEWTAMTGGQNSPASPVNYKGEANQFNLVKSLEGEGAKVIVVNGYDFEAIRTTLNNALEKAAEGDYTVIVIEGTCVKKVSRSAHGQKVKVDVEVCKQCGMCGICPGVESAKGRNPSWNNLCCGCVSNNPACLQMCSAKAISIAAEDEDAGKTEKKTALKKAPKTLSIPVLDSSSRPKRLTVSIRGVGGQGNLFFGKVLSQMAFLAGYGETNIIKGDTHGMAQMGGPVVSTFACGSVYCSQLLPGSTDCLIVMEKSEVLRPGFLSSLKPGGVVLMAETKVLPQGVSESDYPDDDVINRNLEGYNVITLDVLKQAISLGDNSGRSANVVMVGALSAVEPFNSIPRDLWLQAVKNVSSKPTIWDGNYAAFMAGVELI